MADNAKNSHNATITANQVKLSKISTSQTKLTIENGYSFVIEDSDMQVEKKGLEILYHLKNLSETDAGNVKGFYVRRSRPNRKEIKESKVLVEKRHEYSNHVNFRPDLRVQIHLNKNLLDQFDDGVAMYVNNPIYDNIPTIENVVFIPATMFSFYFDKKRYNSDQITPDVVAKMVRSVRLQEMTVDQLLHMSSIISTVQCCYLFTKTLRSDKLLDQFYNLVEINNYMLTRSRHMKFTGQDEENSFRKLPIHYIPYHNGQDSNVEDILFGDPLITHNKTYSVAKAIRADTNIERDLNTMSVKGMYEAFRDGDMFQIEGLFKPMTIYLDRNTVLYDKVTCGFQPIHVMLEELVKIRMRQPEIRKAVVQLLQFCVEKEIHPPTVRRFMKRMVNFRYDIFAMHGIKSLFDRSLVLALEPGELETRFTKMRLLHQHKSNLKLAHLAEAEYHSWAKMLYVDTKGQHPFGNIVFAMQLANSERTEVVSQEWEGHAPYINELHQGIIHSWVITEDQVKQIEAGEPRENFRPDWFQAMKNKAQDKKKVYDDSSIVNVSREDEEEELSFLQRMNPFRGVSAKFASFCEDFSGVHKVMQSAMDLVKERTEKLNLNHTTLALTEIDFGSFGSAFASVKVLINAWFNDFLQKIASMFGIEVKPTIDANLLLFYYIVWSKTDDKTLKTFMIIDIATQLGITDLLFSVVKMMFMLAKEGVKKVFNVSFEDRLAEMTAMTKIKNENSKKILQEEIKAEEKKLDDESGENQVSWLTWAMEKLEGGAPLFLGLAGVSLLAYLGYKNTKSPLSVGFDIVKTSRNISFIALGLAALPKIFNSVVSVVTWTIDYIKKIFVRNHQTQAELVERVNNFLKNGTYVKGVTERAFVRNFAFCVTFNKHFIEGCKLENEMHKIKDNAIRLGFKQKFNTMKELFPVANSAMRIQVGQKEVFHVQLYSEVPGVGKTDVAKSVTKVLGAKMSELENEARKNLGADFRPPESILASGVYPFGFGDHEDGYYGQSQGYIDEDFVFKNPDQNTVVERMTLLSGFPCFSRQAALENKGKLFELQMLVSNTNNAFPQIDGMLCPRAIWRRRILYKIIVKDTCMTNNKIDDAKIIALGLNRTRGEHLLFTCLDPIDTSQKPINDDFINLEIDDFLKLVVAQMGLHYATEEQRLTYEPKKALIRHKYEMFVNDFNDAVSRSLPLEMTLKELSKVKESFIGSIGDREDPKETLCDKMFLEELDNFITVAPHYDDDDDGAVEEIVNYCASTSKTNVSDSFLTETHPVVNHSLQRIVDPERPGKYYYSIKPGNGSTSKSIVGLDFSKFCAFNHDGRLVPAYETTEIITEQMELRVLGVLVQLNLCTSKKQFLKLLTELERKQKSDGKLSIWHDLILKGTNHILDGIKACSSWLMNQVKESVNYIMPALIAGVGIAAAFVTLRVLGDLLSPKNVSYNAVNRKTPQLANVASEYSDVDVSVELAKNSTYRIYFTVDGRTISATVIGIQGSIFLAPIHALSKITETTEIFIYDAKFSSGQPSDAIKAIEISPRDIENIPGTDACLVRLGHFRPVRAVLRHFVDENDLVNNMENFSYCTGNGILLRDQTRPDQFTRYKGLRKFATTGWNTITPTKYENSKFPHERVFEMDTSIEIKHGDSGSLVIHQNPKIARKFLGIIIAMDATSSIAFIGAVTQEQIKNSLKKFSGEAKIETINGEYNILNDDHHLKDVFKFNDEVYKSPIKNQGTSRHSAFVKSEIHGAFPVETFPAIHSIDDPRIPEEGRHFLEVSLNKSNGTSEPNFSNEEEKFMKDFLTATYIKYVPGIETLRLYSTTHAITGIRMKGSTSVNTSTSAGLPYKDERGVKGKKPFIQFDEGTNSWEITQRVFADVDIYEAYYNSGKVFPNLKLEFRKDELVGQNKIDNPKCRTVGTGNMIHQIVYNKLFKDLFTKLKNCWSDNKPTPFALGLDPEKHFGLVAQHLRYLDYVADFDVKAWEEKLCLRFLAMTAEVKVGLLRCAYRYRGESIGDIQMIAHGLAVDFMDAEVVFEDILYRKRSGLLSGHPGTFMENSEVHEMILALCVRRILKRDKPEWATTGFIMEHIRSIKAADDILISVSKTARSIVTIPKIVEEYNKLGFEITAADKSDDISAKTLNDVQFLKHHFRIGGPSVHEVNPSFTPIPNMSIIYQLFNWLRDDTKLTRDVQFKENIRAAFRFAFWRGREEYERIRETFNMAVLKKNISWSTTYDEMIVILRHESAEKAIERSMNYPYSNKDDYMLNELDDMHSVF